VLSAQCSVHTIQCTVFSAQCTVFSAQFTVFSAHRVLRPPPIRQRCHCGLALGPPWPGTGPAMGDTFQFSPYSPAIPALPTPLPLLAALLILSLPYSDSHMVSAKLFLHSLPYDLSHTLPTKLSLLPLLYPPLRQSVRNSPHLPQCFSQCPSQCSLPHHYMLHGPIRGKCSKRINPLSPALHPTSVAAISGYLQRKRKNFLEAFRKVGMVPFLASSRSSFATHNRACCSQ
jgi:hypothetical protein